MEWGDLLRNWQRLKISYAHGNPAWEEAAGRLGGLANVKIKRDGGWCSQNDSFFGSSFLRNPEHLDEYKKDGFQRFGCSNTFTMWDKDFIGDILNILNIGQNELGNLLCRSCMEAIFATSLGPIEAVIANRALKEYFCHHCTEKLQQNPFDSLNPFPWKASRRCSICQSPACLSHSQECEQCGYVWCQAHQLERCSSCPRPKSRRLVQAWNGLIYGLWFIGEVLASDESRKR